MDVKRENSSVENSMPNRRNLIRGAGLVLGAGALSAISHPAKAVTAIDKAGANATSYDSILDKAIDTKNQFWS